MKKNNAGLTWTWVFSGLIILLWSCNTKTESEKLVINDPEPKVELVPINGDYHYLIGSREDFLLLKERPPINIHKGKGLLLFKNNITDSGITLHGWTYKIADTVFSTTPNIKLSVGKDTLTFQSGSYLSDFILPWKDLKEIKKDLKANINYKSVVFQPMYYDNSKMQVAYKINYSEALPFNFVKRVEKLIPAGRVLNPIPPGGGTAFDD